MCWLRIKSNHFRITKIYGFVECEYKNCRPKTSVGQGPLKTSGQAKFGSVTTFQTFKQHLEMKIPGDVIIVHKHSPFTFCSPSKRGMKKNIDWTHLWPKNQLHSNCILWYSVWISITLNIQSVIVRWCAQCVLSRCGGRVKTRHVHRWLGRRTRTTERVIEGVTFWNTRDILGFRWRAELTRIRWRVGLSRTTKNPITFKTDRLSKKSNIESQNSFIQIKA